MSKRTLLAGILTALSPLAIGWIAHGVGQEPTHHPVHHKEVVLLELGAYQAVLPQPSCTPGLVVITANRVQDGAPTALKSALVFNLASADGEATLAPAKEIPLDDLGSLRGLLRGGGLFTKSGTGAQAKLLATSDTGTADITPGNLAEVLSAMPQSRAQLRCVGEDVLAAYSLQEGGDLVLWAGKETLRRIDCVAQLARPCLGYDDAGLFLWFQAVTGPAVRFDSKLMALTTDGLGSWSARSALFQAGGKPMGTILTQGPCASLYDDRIVITWSDGESEEVILKDFLTTAPDGKQRSAEESAQLNLKRDILEGELTLLRPNEATQGRLFTHILPLSSHSLAVTDLFYNRVLVFEER